MATQNRQMDDKFILRFPDGWRDRLKERAARSRRSMNSEILCILQSALGTAAGEDFGEDTPAAGNDNAVLADGASTTQMKEPSE